MQIDKANIQVWFVRESNGEKIFSVTIPHSDDEAVIHIPEWNEQSGVWVLKKMYNEKLATLVRSDGEKAALAKVKAEIETAVKPQPEQVAPAGDAGEI